MTVLALILLSGIAHEAGHALCARAHGLTARVFLRWPISIGVAVEPGTGAQSRSVAAAGPLASFLYAFTLLALGYRWAGGWCIVLGLLMLLPIRRFDGWHILHWKEVT